MEQGVSLSRGWGNWRVLWKQSAFCLGVISEAVCSSVSHALGPRVWEGEPRLPKL